MAREATGELRILADGYAARITIKGRTRQDFMLVTCTTETEAAERCKALASMASRLRRAGKVSEIVRYVEQGAKARAGRPWAFVEGAVDLECAGIARDKGAAQVPLFPKWAEQWTSGELAKRYPDHVKAKKTSDRDEEILRLYVNPHVQDVRVDEFTLEHGEYIMANIPAQSSRTGKPLRPGTRRHIAQVVSRLMRLAVYPGKYRKDNPIPRGWLPSAGDPPALECIYPDEDTLLLGGHSVQPGKAGVPLLRRLAYGFIDREGLREDEMANLRWRDVDLKRGRVTLDENKTDDPRDWDLRPDVVEALKRWRKLQGAPEGDEGNAERVFAEEGIPLNVEHLAEQLRRDLQRVGVTRSQLFERKAGVRNPIRVHDLRATFVTIGLATGQNETWISDRTGHKSHTMVTRYRRKARTWNLGQLGPLHELIPELRSGRPARGPASPIAPRLPHTHTARVAKQADAADLGWTATQPDSPGTEETSPVSDASSPEVAPTEQVRGNGGAIDAVEMALARALTEASAAGRFDVVAQLAGELETRRVARTSGNVVDLGARRRTKR